MRPRLGARQLPAARRAAGFLSGVRRRRPGVRWCWGPRPGCQDRGAGAGGALAAIGSPAVCLEWSATWALAAGTTEDEITDVLQAIAPVAGLGRVVCAVPDVADAFGYDIEAALEDRDNQ